MGPIYAIGDIHGYAERLEAALAWVETDGGPDAHIVFLGDYVDRGPESRAVVERLRTGVAEGRPWTVLRGNHDRMFCRFVQGGVVHDDRISSGHGWLNAALGGVKTLASYGVAADEFGPMDRIWAAARAAVPADHIAFLADRPLTYQTGTSLFVHAGIRPGVALADQEEDDLVWIREPFLSHPNPFEWLIVHGHTALEHPVHYGNRVDLDGGTGYGRPLSPAVFEGDRVWILGPKGRTALDPITAVAQ